MSNDINMISLGGGLFFVFRDPYPFAEESECSKVDEVNNDLNARTHPTHTHTNHMPRNSTKLLSLNRQ